MKFTELLEAIMDIPHPQRYFLGAGKLAALVKAQLGTSGLLMTADVQTRHQVLFQTVSDARTLALTIAGPMACPPNLQSARSTCFNWSLIMFDSAKPHI